MESGTISEVVGGQPKESGIDRTIEAANNAGNPGSVLSTEELEERYESRATTTDARLERERSEGREENARAAGRLGQDRPIRSGSRGDEYARQERSLEEYAKENGLWFSVDEIEAKTAKKFRSGKEADVYLEKDGKTVIKVVNYSQYSETPLDFIENRILLFNELFNSTAYTIIGYTQTDKGFSFVVKQPFIKGRLLDNPFLAPNVDAYKAQQQRVVDYMQDKFGMQPSGLDAFSDGEMRI